MRGRYPVDGQMLTVDEIAALIGSTPHGVRIRRSRMGGVSYQAMVDMYRAGAFGNMKDKNWRYLIEGRWMTTDEIARMLGINKHTLSCWRSMHRGPDGKPPSMDAAIDHFRDRAREGYVRCKPKAYRINGQMMTVADVARRYGVKPGTIYAQMSGSGISLAEVVRRREARKQERAEREIMKILGY